MKQPVAERTNRGSVALMMAVGAVAVLGFAALAIDVGYSLATKSQLQNVADSGSIAGSRELVNIYKEKTAAGSFNYAKYTLTSTDKARVLSKVNEFTLQNRAAGVPISIGPSDVTFGVWSAPTRTFASGSTGVNAVTVTARRDGTTNGSVATLLASVLGVDSYAIRASTSVNGLSGLKSMPAGKGDVPFGISKAWFTDRGCDSNPTIKFHPTGSTVGCAGWHVFTDSPSSASKLRSIIQGLQAGTYTTPETVADETIYNFTGGSVASAFPYFVQLFNSKKAANGTWQVRVPVYDKNDCSNPNSNLKIIGFATARITEVKTSPQNEITANVVCNIVAPSWGNPDGPSYGTAVELSRVVQ